MKQIKSTLKIFKETDVKGEEGRAPGHITKVLLGNKERPSERLYPTLNTFEAGTHIPLHWHPVEALYFAIAGRAIVKDIEGNSYEIRPGNFIYISPGIACAHEWEIKERLQLIAVRATTEPQKNIQFTVDRSTMQSSIDVDFLVKQGGDSFKSWY